MKILLVPQYEMKKWIKRLFKHLFLKPTINFNAFFIRSNFNSTRTMLRGKNRVYNLLFQFSWASSSFSRCSNFRFTFSTTVCNGRRWMENCVMIKFSNKIWANESLKRHRKKLKRSRKASNLNWMQNKMKLI